ncbi:MAG: hypothetical protein WAQ08_16005 [Aquabacterium sp.]|uniref:hypothetical protein n=1 Tax=Aquabacterium sp. TaxID=1872578 RepID=UPI003BB03EAA
MNEVLQPGTIPANALAALALIYPEHVTEGGLLEAIGQPDFDELPTVMTLSVTMGYVVRELKAGGWVWRATAEGVAVLAEQPDAAEKPGLSPMQRMTQAAARKPPVATAKQEKQLPVAKAKEAPAPAAPAGNADASLAGKPALPDSDQAALDAIPPLADVNPASLGVAVIDHEPVRTLSDKEVQAVLVHSSARTGGGVLAACSFHFDCALSANGVLRIEQDDQSIDIKVENARKLLRYLDRIRPEEDAA